MGALANFASEATEFATSFPGIQTHLLTLASNFKLPFFRDFIMALGTGSVSRASCENILRQGPGTSITIVVGGATESLKAHPGTADLTLRRRLGFIKIAIRNGASLVPVFAFGENDIYAQLANEKGTAIYQFQKRFQALFGFTLPLFHGRGVFNYHIGLLPFRHPIVACVGRPIETVQNKHPTQAEIEEVQERYIAELKRYVTGAAFELSYLTNPDLRAAFGIHGKTSTRPTAPRSSQSTEKEFVDPAHSSAYHLDGLAPDHVARLPGFPSRRQFPDTMPAPPHSAREPDRASCSQSETVLLSTVQYESID